jgi:DNA segregation ATPase FtsK/SpoIIIE-like protein
LEGEEKAKRILSLVETEHGLTTAQILGLLRERTGVSIFEMGTMANVDSAAFHKIFRNSENRFLQHDHVVALVEGLVSAKHLAGNGDDITAGEAGLWMLALQAASAADAQVALLRRRNPSASESAIEITRSRIVAAMRDVWVQTGSVAPARPGVLPPPQETRPLTEEERSEARMLVTRWADEMFEAICKAGRAIDDAPNITPDRVEADEGLQHAAAALVLREGRVSASLIQRHFSIGYNIASEIVEELERRGIVSSPDELGKRTVNRRVVFEGAIWEHLE